MSMNLNVKSSMMESVSAPEQPQVDVLAAGVRQNRRGRGSLRGLNLSADSEGASHEMSALLQLSSNDATEVSQVTEDDIFSKDVAVGTGFLQKNAENIAKHCGATLHWLGLSIMLILCCWYGCLACITFCGQQNGQQNYQGGEKETKQNLLNNGGNNQGNNGSNGNGGGDDEQMAK